MSRLVWDNTGEHKFEMGVSRGVLYVAKDTVLTTDTSRYNTGVVWNGLTGVTNSPDGAEPTDLWADNIKYATLRSAETFGATIEAYTYPDEFGVCDGSVDVSTGSTYGVRIGQQTRKAFGFCYRTELGNDQNPNAGYLIHIIYNCTASPSERNYETVNDSPDAITFSWEINSNPVNVSGHKPTSEIVIDSTKLTSAKLTAIENMLYGSESGSATLPDPDLVISTINNAT